MRATRQRRAELRQDRPGRAAGAIWHPSDPYKIRHLGYYGQGLRIHEYDIRTDQSTVLADLGARVRERFPRATSMWTKQEGRPSNDGRIWCLRWRTRTSPFRA
ncbi:MAG: hypothetical protein U1E77_05295 [Inhella sp.]